MEQSLHQLRQALSITDQSENQTGGYLKYIKIKYPKVEESEVDEKRRDYAKALQREYESALTDNIGCPSSSDVYNVKLKTLNEIDGNFNYDEIKASDLLSSPSVTSGGSLDGPNPILFDNFVIEDDVDYGDYLPTGLSIHASHAVDDPDCDKIENPFSAESSGESFGYSTQSTLTKGPRLLNVDSMNRQAIVMNSSERIRTDADIFLQSYLGTFVAEEIEDLVDEDKDALIVDGKEERRLSASYIEEDDDDSFSSDDLPVRAVEALNSMRNAGQITALDSSDVYSETGLSKEISEVYDYVEDNEP